MSIKKSLFIPLLLLILVSSVGCSLKPTGNAAAQRGIEAYRERDFQTAAKELKTGLESDITRFDEDQIWTILGNAYDELDEYEEAEKAHKRALEINPKSHQAWTNLGAVYRHAGKYDDAENAYKKALELNPDYPELHASLGALYVVRGEPEKAIESIEKALKLEPELTVAHANLALAYAKVGRFDDADVALQKAQDMGYRNGENLGQMIEEEKNTQSGVK